MSRDLANSVESRRAGFVSPSRSHPQSERRVPMSAAVFARRALAVTLSYWSCPRFRHWGAIGRRFVELIGLAFPKRPASSRNGRRAGLRSPGRRRARARLRELGDCRRPHLYAGRRAFERNGQRRIRRLFRSPERQTALEQENWQALDLGSADLEKFSEHADGRRRRGLHRDAVRAAVLPRRGQW